MAEITQAMLHELFTYDPETGRLTWKPRPMETFARSRTAAMWATRFAGKPAGHINGDGYWQVKFGGKYWQVHRLIWLYVHGEMPELGYQIDHIDRDRANNRLTNLRKVTPSQNSRNRSMRSDSTSGAIGVRWNRRDQKWQAQIKINGAYIHLGSFATLESAAEARARAEVEFGYCHSYGRSAA